MKEVKSIRNRKTGVKITKIFPLGMPGVNTKRGEEEIFTKVIAVKYLQIIGYLKTQIQEIK